GGHRPLDRCARRGVPGGSRGPGARALGAAQPGRAQACRGFARRPGRLGDDLAGLPAEARRRHRMTDLSGRTALVTGASKGIGAEIAAALGKAGANVIAHYGSDRAGAEEATAAIPDEGKLVVGADLMEPGAPERLWEAAVSWRGAVDVLVNNAAVM